ncbi:MAG: 50S ribosomal protein L22 [Pyrinomonadaceae bacterium]
MEAIAKTKYLKGSPRKARLVIDMIRGVNVSRALSILKFTEKRAADPISKCLNSAIANATFKAEQQNIAIDPDDLWVKSCFVDMGPHKHRSRMRPAPQGRAYREQRHYCHITIEVTSEQKPKTEQEIALEEARAARIAARKAEKAKAPKKETKSAKADKPSEAVVEEAVETPVVETEAGETEITAPTETVEELVETAPADENVEAAAGETPVADESVEDPVPAPPIEASPDEVAAEVEAQADAEVADAKNVSVQTPAVLDETKPADEAQQDINEDLEKI